MVAKTSHKHDKRNLDTSLMLRMNKAAVESNLKLSDKSKELTDMSGEFTLNYPGKKIGVTQTIIESKEHQFTSNMNVQIGKSKNAIITAWKRTSPSALMISSNVNLQNIVPMKLEAEYSLGPKTYTGKGLVSKGKSTYSAAVSTELEADSIQITSDLQYPSRHIVATFDGTKSGDKYSSRADLRLNADIDDTNRIVLTGSGSFPSRHNIDGSLTLQYPGRTVALNFKNIAQNKFISHVDFQWESEKVISIDTSYGDVSKRDIREIVGDLKLRTPFRRLKTFDITLNQHIQDSQYVTTLDMEWNPKQIVSTTFTLRRPLSLSSLNAELVAKTPIKSMKNIQASLSHKFDDQLSTVISAKWNRQSIQADISLTKKGEENIKGQIDLKTSFRELKKAGLSLSYLNNLRKKAAELKLVKNKDTYTISSELKHNTNGWNVQNSGNFIILLPNEAFNTEWNHANTMNDISTSGTMTWKDNRVAIKYNGHQEMAVPAGKMRSSLEVQSTFAPIRDIMLTMNHEHSAGNIDSTITLSKDGSNIASADGKYTRQDGRVTSIFRMTNPLGPNDLSAKIDSAYQNYPMTARIELSASPDLTAVLDGSVMVLAGDIDSSVQLKVPFTKPVTLKFAKSMDSGDVKTTGSVQYLPGKTLSYESRYRNDLIKKMHLDITPPSSRPISFELEIDGSSQPFKLQGKINAMPLIDTWSAVGSWDSSDGLSCNLRVNTPYDDLSYVQASAESKVDNGESRSTVTVEYLPNKIVKLVSVYSLSDPTDLKGSIKITTPFKMIPYTSVGFTHHGDLREFNNMAEVEYQAGKRLTTSASFSSTNGLMGSARITSPFTTDISGMFSHTGDINNFKSHAEATWGKTTAIDIENEYASSKYRTNLDISVGSDKYEAEIKFEKDPKLSSEITLKTPLKRFENIKMAHTFDGNYQDFSSHSEFSSSYLGQYVTDVDLNLISPMSGDVSIRTPHKGYRNMRVAFTHDGSMGKFASHVELENGNDRIIGDIKLNTDSIISFEAAMQTPFQLYRLSRVAYTHDGTLTNFKCHAELQRNKEISEVDLSASVNKKIDVDLKVRSPYMNTLKVSFDHWGSLKKFTSKLRASQGKLKVNSDVRFQIQPTFNTFISLKTPISFLKNQQLSLKHAGGLNSFKCNMQYKCNGKTYIGDASFDNMKSKKGELNLRGPNFKPVGASLTLTGFPRDFHSTAEVSYGKKKMQVNANLDIVNGINGKLTVVSPFDAFEKIDLVLSHSGPFTNFKSQGLLSVDRQMGQVDVSFDATGDIAASLSIQTPFKEMKDISTSITHIGDLKDFNTVVRYNQNKQMMEGKVGFNAGPVMTGAASLRSSFSNIGNYEASFRHEDRSGVCKNHGELILAGQRSEVDLDFDSNRGYSGSMTIRSPVIKDTEVAYKHSLTESAMDSNAYISYGGDKKFNLVAFGSVDSTISGNFKLETPVSEMSIYHDGPLNNFRSHAEIVYRNDKSEADVEFSSVSNIMGKMLVKSQLFKTIETTFSYNNARQNLQASAEASYGELNNKGEISIRYSPDIAIEFISESPIFEPLMIKLEHSGPITNCRTTAEYLSGGESKFNWNSNIVLQSGDVMGDVTVRTPIAGYRRFGGSVKHTGELTNFKTASEAFCDNSVHKGELSFSPNEGKLSIESSLIKPVEAGFTLDGQFPDFKFQTKLDFGSETLLNIGANLNTKSSIDGDLVIFLPKINRVNTLRVTFNHRGILRRFDSHAEVSFGSFKTEGDVSFNSIDSLEGRIAIQVTDMTPVSASFRFDGKNTDFKTHAEVVYGYDKHEVDAAFSIDTKLETSFTSSSPLMRALSLSFVTTTDPENIDSNAKVIYDGVTKLDVSMSWTLKPISGSITVITQRNALKSKFNFDGIITKFQSDAELTMNGQTTKVDAALNLEDKFDGNFEVTSPAMYPTSLNFDCDSRMNDYKCSAAVDFQTKRHTAEIAMSLGDAKEGIISLQSPYLGSYSGKVSTDGSSKSFRTNAELVVNGKKVSTEAGFSMIGDIDAHLNINTPFKGFERNDISFTLTHSGNIKNFRGNAILTVNKAITEISVSYNIVTALEGSLSIKTPFTKDLDVMFEQSGPKVTLSVNYESETLFSTEISYNKVPLRGNMKLELPFSSYKTISAAFSHDGSLLKSTNHFEITVDGRASEADLSFNFGSKLEGSVTLKCPYTDDVTAGFDVSGTITNFNAHAEFQHGSNKYAVDTTLDSTNDISGEVIVSTPFAGYKRINGKLSYYGTFPFVNSKVQITANRRNLGIIGIQLTNSNRLSGSATVQSVFTPNIEISFNHQGNLRDFASDAELRYNGQSNTASISFRTSPVVEGAVSLSLPAFQIDDLISNFKYDGNLENFKLNGESRLGRQVISTEVTFTSQKQIALAASLKTPFNGFEDIQGGIALKEKYGGYGGHMEFDLGGIKKSEIDLSYTWTKTLKASIIVKSPYPSLRNFKADLRHSGSLPTIRSGLTVSHSSKEYTFSIDVEELSRSNGKVSVTTPFDGYENTVVQYSVQGDIPNFSADAKITAAGGKEISGSFRNTLSGQKLETKVNLLTPYTEDMEFELIHSGPAEDFNNLITLSMGPDNVVSTTTSLKFDRSSLDFETTISTILAGYSDEQKASCKFDGSKENFKTNTYLKLLGNEFSVDSSIQSSPSIDWKLALKTPFTSLKDIQLSLEHSGNMRRFTSKAEVQYEARKKVEGTVSYSRYGWRRLQTSVEILTPFAGFERSSASYIHSASVDSFECNADLNVMNKDFSGTLKAAKTPLSSSLVVRTPYENYDDLRASMKLDSESAEVSVTYKKDKTITFTSEAKLESSPKVAFVKITTPFQGFESSELRIDHSGDMNNFQSNALLKTPFTNTMKAQTNLRSSSFKDFEGSLMITSEIKNFENLKLNVENRIYGGKYNTRVETSWAPGKEIILDNSFTLTDGSQTGKLSLSTPFEAVRQLLVKSDRQFTATKFQMTETTILNGKTVSDYDVELSKDRGLYASLTSRAPIECEIEFSGIADSGKYSGKTYINWKPMETGNSVRVEGEIDTQRDNAYSIKYQCPTNTIDVIGSLGTSNSKMGISFNGDHYGYDATYSRKDGKIKLMFPTRSIELFGSYDSKTTEGYFKWDADRDETKMISIRSVIVPSGDSMKADFSLMMPSVGKVYKL